MGGYDPDFIPGCEVPLPSHRDMFRIAARNAEALLGANIDELQYHHFSIVMHRMQWLALFAACNIDGRKPKKVDRDTGAVRLASGNGVLLCH
jgi:endonuclease G